MTRTEVESLFKLAGFDVRNIKALVDGYGYSPDDPRFKETLPRLAWWFVKTEYGWIEIGERKHVISINWADTDFRQIVTTDDVTKDLDKVHAYSIEKALEYLKALRRMAA